MGVKRMILRRIILAIPAALSALTIIFAVLLLLSPTMRVALFIQTPRDLKPENLEKQIHAAGLDQPIPVQYINWLQRVIKLDFGHSLSSDAPAMSLVLESLPVTLELILYSLPLTIILGVWLGTKAALNHNKTVDHVARIVGTAGASFPVFLLAELLIMLCVAQFKYYPGGGLDNHVRFDLNVRIGQGAFTSYTGMLTIDALLNGDMPLFADAIKHLVFPVALLVFTQTATLVKVTRSGLIEESGKTYVLSAMTKGLSKRKLCIGMQEETQRSRFSHFPACYWATC